nr:helix-turn-helix transcriptional regulator [Egibacter rhizosphaerae]
MGTNGRDRLRELLDAVLQDTEGPADGAHRRLDDLAEGAFSSPYHFSRLLSRATGEPPITMRRRVLLERAGWQLARDMSVTDAAWAAGYESVEGFSRAFTRALAAHRPARRGPATGCLPRTASTSTRPRRCGCTPRSSR